jgi:hypothetical protein
MTYLYKTFRINEVVETIDAINEIRRTGEGYISQDCDMELSDALDSGYRWIRDVGDPAAGGLAIFEKEVKGPND